jgi:hypothetical protein
MGYHPALMVSIIVTFVPLFGFIPMRNWVLLHQPKLNYSAATVAAEKAPWFRK